MSNIVYRYENSRSFKVKGVKHLVKESVIDCEKGLSFVLTKKEGDSKFSRLYVKEVSKDKFEVRKKVNDKETVEEINMVDLKKMLKFGKDFEFVREYVENERYFYHR